MMASWVERILTDTEPPVDELVAVPNLQAIHPQWILLCGHLQNTASNCWNG